MIKDDILFYIIKCKEIREHLQILETKRHEFSNMNEQATKFF